MPFDGMGCQNCWPSQLSTYWPNISRSNAPNPASHLERIDLAQEKDVAFFQLWLFTDWLTSSQDLRNWPTSLCKKHHVLIAYCSKLNILIWWCIKFMLVYICFGLVWVKCCTWLSLWSFILSPHSCTCNIPVVNETGLKDNKYRQ